MISVRHKGIVSIIFDVYVLLSWDDARQSESFENEGPVGASNYTKRHGWVKRSGSRHSKQTSLFSAAPAFGSRYFSIFLLVRVTDRLI